jgi:hypothetical protein
MDWFERWFGISPDAGDGSTEFLYVAAAVAIVGLLVLLRLTRRLRG